MLRQQKLNFLPSGSFTKVVAYWFSCSDWWGCGRRRFHPHPNLWGPWPAAGTGSRCKAGLPRRSYGGCHLSSPTVPPRPSPSGPGSRERSSQPFWVRRSVPPKGPSRQQAISFRWSADRVEEPQRLYDKKESRSAFHAPWEFIPKHASVIGRVGKLVKQDLHRQSGTHIYRKGFCERLHVTDSTSKQLRGSFPFITLLTFIV